jgi:hypothetical protein
MLLFARNLTRERKEKLQHVVTAQGEEEKEEEEKEEEEKR